MNIKKILVSQPTPVNNKSPYFDIAAKHGIEVSFRPFVKIEGVSAKEFRTQRINLADFTVVIFTSRNAIDHYFRLCEETRFEVPNTMRYICTSESIALYLQKYIVYRKRKIGFGASGKLDDSQFLQTLSKNEGEKFLFPVSDVHNSGSTDQIDKLNLDITKATMFRTVSNDFGPDEKFDYDVVLFFSPAGVQSMKKNFPDFDQEKEKVYIGALGTKTAQAVTDAGFRLDIVAPAPGVTSLPSALEQFLSKKK